MKRCFAVMLCLLVVVSFSLAHATVFWTDDFESALYPNWDTSNCGTPASSFPDGCNPSRSTTLSHSATHSFWSHFTNIDVQAGTFMDRHTTETQHLYMRFYYRTTAFTYNDIGTKHFYNTSDMEFMDLIWINSWGSRQMNATINHPATVTCPPTDRGGTTDTTCNYYPNLVAIDLNDNQWYCIETHVYVGSPGTANGVVEQWIDGVKTMNYTGLNIRTGSGGMNIVRHYAQVGLGDRYIDDLAVGDTRFNDCTGGGGGGSTAGGGLDF